MMNDFFITDADLKSLKDSIANIDYRFKNQQGYFRHVGNYVRELFLKSFQSDGLPVRWTSLSPAYLSSQKKINSNYPTGILKLSGNMMGSFTKLGSSNNIQKITRNIGVYGSNNPIAAYHYHGTRKMPQRDPIQVPDDFVKTLTKKLVDFLAGVFNDR